MSEPDIQQDDIEAVVAVLKSKTLSLGPVLEQFERAFADYIGTKYAVAVSSGTAGLHLCMHALNLKVGDEVITTPFGFVASANSILYEGAKPVFADIEDDSLNISPDAVKALVTNRTRAIMPVHVFGQPADMGSFVALSGQLGVPVIEDACEAIGAEFQSRKVGTFGRAAVFSFYPNKQITTGEGAVITTDDSATASLLRSLRNQGRDEMGTWLHHIRLGYNYRLSEMSAALGLSQLKRVDDLLQRRKQVATLYFDRLSGIRNLSLPAVMPSTTRMSWFVFVVRLDAAIDRDAISKRLAARGIPTRAYFSPIHLQPYMRETFGYGPGDFPVTERVARSTLALPFHPNLTSDDVDAVVEALHDAIDQG